MEREVQGRDGHWYSLRMRPYKTAENKIDGVLMALMDIDVMKRGLDQPGCPLMRRSPRGTCRPASWT